MKKNGFTLIELLGVIVILSILVILVLPKVTNSVKNSSKDTDSLMEDMIYKASDLYISNNSNDFPKKDGNKYSIELKELVDAELLSSPIKLSYSDDITNSKCVQVTYDNKYKFELKDSGACEVTEEIVTPETPEQPKVCKLTYDLNSNKQVDIGDQVTCGSETFYRIPNDSTAHPTAIGDNITLLTKYNLDVGVINKGDNYTYPTNGTGIQSEEAIGEDYDYPYYGVLAFSYENYWGQKSEGTFIYKNDSSVSAIPRYVHNYKTYMINLGVDVKEASLASYNQFHNFRTNYLPQNFVYTSFWIGSAGWDHYDNVYIVAYDGTNRGRYGSPVYSNVLFSGVRPIIVIPKSNIGVS